MAVQHTPLPWAQMEVDKSAVVSLTDGKQHYFVAECYANAAPDTSGFDNAAFIVRACNAHYQMLEALKVAQSALAMLTDPEAIKTNRVQVAWATAVEAELATRLAIAAAEAEGR